MLDYEEIKALVFGLGADDVGFVEMERPALDPQRDDILKAFPRTRTLISIVCRMNREPIRTPDRSVSNLEFHATGDQVNEVCRKLVRALERRGIRALNPAMGFPMEQDRFPGKTWVVSHKPVAEAAGLGRVGLHRNVIHPKFGSFILLGTVLVEKEVSRYDSPLLENPCFECKLCVAACPVGAIEPDGFFNFSSCYTHNYREFMGGFTDWVETVADSRSASDYRSRVTDAESSSMWQSLSFGPNYKAAYCLSVCPAGEDVIGPFLESRAGFLKETVRPLQDKAEPVYIVRGSDAELVLKKRFPKKTPRYVNGLRPSSVAGFHRGLKINFQRKASKGLHATYAFEFTGREPGEVTVVISDGELTVRSPRADDKVDLKVKADSATWISFLRKDISLLRALVTRRIRLQGSPKLLVAFGRCFPG
jgi:ferredoxin